MLAATGLTAGTAYLAVTTGDKVPVTVRNHVMEAAPAVKMALDHPFLLGIAFLGLCMVASITRKAQVGGPLALMAFAVASGLLMGPGLAYAAFKADLGLTLLAHPIRDAGILTAVMFVGLSAYALYSGRDFSFMGGFLLVGLLLLIAAGVLNLFLGSLAVHLALASVGVILFTGFILYDTSKILHGPKDDAVGDALGLYLDVLNLFSDLLTLLRDSKD